MLFEKQILKKLHNLHMAVKNLNPQLWICIYNGFSIIPDSRKTGITKNLATFWQKYFLCIFVCALLIYLQKKLDSYLLWVFYDCSSNLHRNLK